MKPKCSSAINETQAAFYDSFHTEEKLNWVSRLWRRFRRRVKSKLDLTSQVSQMQAEWVREEQPKAMLEIGCYDGSEVTISLIHSIQSMRYTGIELSTAASGRFLAKVAGSPAASRVQVVAGDVLVHEFGDERYDVIYMNGVLHHFPDMDQICRRIVSLLKPNGCLITFDPMITNPLFRTLRNMYRPFQSDKDWEFPFSRETFDVLQKYFVIERVQGFMGKGMYLGCLSILPVFGSLFDKAAKNATEHDRARAIALNDDFWRCNTAVQRLRVKPTSTR